MTKSGQREAAARREAQVLWNNRKQREVEALKEKQRQADADKVARLRALRLAKEAADRETPPQPATTRRSSAKS